MKTTLETGLFLSICPSPKALRPTTVLHTNNMCGIPYLQSSLNFNQISNLHRTYITIKACVLLRWS